MAEQLIKNAEKVDFITSVHESRREKGIDTLYLLLSMLIHEARIDADIIQPEELRKNQGRIAAFQELKGYIENGVGIPEARQYGTRIKSMAELKIPTR
jgi:hypothetical protein